MPRTDVSANEPGESSDQVVVTFKNLPKYDADRKVLEYKVTEKMKLRTDNSYPDTDTSVDQYVTTIGDENYTYSTGDANDQQTCTYTNVRIGSITPRFYKLWKDNSNAEKLRSDITFHLYRKVFYLKNGVSSSSAIESMGDVRSKWDVINDSSDILNWRCVFADQPQYVTQDMVDQGTVIGGVTMDSSMLGAEIRYYAQETMSITGDYATTYEDPADTATYHDSVTEDANLTDSDFNTTTTAGTGNVSGYVMNGGRVVNTLSGYMTMYGKKIWANVPTGTTKNIELLPQAGDIQFTLQRGIKDSNGNINYTPATDSEGTITALLEVSGPDNSGNYNYQYHFYQKGSTTVLRQLPKYDADGNKYYYTVTEDYVKESDKATKTEIMKVVYPSSSTVVSDFSVTNVYSTGQQMTIQVHKSWEQIESTSVHPTVAYKLYQLLPNTVKSVSGVTDTMLTESNLIATKTYTYSAVSDQVDFAGLPVFCTNMEPYQYVVVETPINDYKTYAADTTVLTNEGNKVLIVGTYDEKNNNQTKNAYFKNAYQGSSITELNGTKKWVDYASTADSYSRPTIENANAQTKLTLKVERKAAGIDGSAWTTITSSNYSLVWSQDTTNVNIWKYIITPKDDTTSKSFFTKYATNGSLYQYRVTESCADTSYGDYSANGTGSPAVNAPTDSDSATFGAITNTFGTQYSFKKIWSDNNNHYKLRPKYITIQLQVKKDGDTSYKPFKEVFEDGKINGTAYTSEVTLTNDSTLQKAHEGYVLSTDFSYTFQKLPQKAEDNKVYSYRVREIAIGAATTDQDVSDDTDQFGTYKASYTDTAVAGTAGNTTAKNALASTALQVKKVWSDETNKYGVRPSSITVYLQRKLNTEEDTSYQYIPYDTSVTSQDSDYLAQTISSANASDSNTWETEFSDLPQYDDNGNQYVYRAVEVTPVTKVNTMGTTSYTLTSTESNTGSTTLTNTLNTQESEYRSLTVHKNWMDSGNKDASRPESIQVVLKYKEQDSEKDFQTFSPTITATLTANGSGTEEGTGNTLGNWSYTWTRLPKYASSGKALIYTVEELSGSKTYVNSASNITYQYKDSYVYKNGTTTENSVSESTSSIELTDTLLTDATVTKSWSDDNDKYGIRSKIASVQVQLQSREQTDDSGNTYSAWNNVSGKAANLTNANNWFYRFTNLPLYNGSGKLIEYRVVETQITLTTKKNNKNVTVTVSGTETDTPVNAVPGSDWSNTAVTIDSIAGQKVGAYGITGTTVKKKFATDASHNVAAYATVLTNTLQTRSVYAEKIWEDNENQDGLRPYSVTLKLAATGATISDTDAAVTLTGTKTENPVTTGYEYEAWKAQWDSLPLYAADGTVITYTIAETEVKQTQDAAAIKVVTPKTGSPYFDMPTTFAGDTAQITGRYTITYNQSGNGAKIGETVTPLTVTNRHTPLTTSLTAIKFWKDTKTDTNSLFDFISLLRPNKAVFELQQKIGEADWTKVTTNTLQGTNPQDVTAGSSNQGQAYWSGIPLFADGVAIQYRVVEVQLKGYTMSVSGNDSSYLSYNQQDQNIVGISNTMDTTSYSYTKLWADDNNKYNTRQDMTYKLQYSSDNGTTWNDLKVGTTTTPQTVVVTADSAAASQTIAFSGLMKTDQNGNAMKYRAVETAIGAQQITGQTESSTSVTGGSAAGYTVAQEYNVTKSGVTGDYITNTLDTVTLKGTKTWVDEDNHFNLRPDSIALKISYADGKNTVYLTDTQMAALTWTKGAAGTAQQNTWTYEIKGLPKYLSSGSVRTYTVTEDTTTLGKIGYVGTSQTSGYETNFTNTLSLIAITGTKTWSDDSDKWKLRPAQPEITLMAKSKTITEEAVALLPGQLTWTADQTDSNKQNFTIKDLPRYDKDGNAITYTVDEKQSAGYQTPVVTDGTQDSSTGNITGISLTNTLETAGALGVEKKLASGSNQLFSFRVMIYSGEAAGKVYTGTYKRYDVTTGKAVAASDALYPSGTEGGTGAGTGGSGMGSSGSTSVEGGAGSGTANEPYYETAKDGTITIYAGERFVLTGLPAGASYEVTEVVPSAYTAVYAGQKGEIHAEEAATQGVTGVVLTNCTVTNTLKPTESTSSGGSSTTTPTYHGMDGKTVTDIDKYPGRVYDETGKIVRGAVVGYDENGKKLYEGDNPSTVYDQYGKRILSPVLDYDTDGNVILDPEYPGKVYDGQGNMVRDAFQGYSSSGDAVYDPDYPGALYNKDGGEVRGARRGYSVDGTKISSVATGDQADIWRDLFLMMLSAAAFLELYDMKRKNLRRLERDRKRAKNRQEKR